MATITLKNIPEPIHQALKAQALAHHRSLNGEVIACLEMALLDRPSDPEAILEKIAAHRNRLPGTLTEDLLLEARKDRRP